jgi:hypothetical protein
VRWDPLLAVIYALATYRLTRLVVVDSITGPLRERVWRTRPPHESRLGYLLTCPWCTSVWAASALVLFGSIAPVTDVVALVLALSAVAGLLAARAD